MNAIGKFNDIMIEIFIWWNKDTNKKSYAILNELNYHLSNQNIIIEVINEIEQVKSYNTQFLILLRK